MDKPNSKIEREPEKIPTVNEITEVAQEHYELEPGTKNAVDNGIITMQELTILHYVYAYLNENDISPEENDDQYFFRACQKTATIFNLDEDIIKKIFEKVYRINRS